MLETVGDIPSAASLDAWRERVVRMRADLGWPDAPIVARQHATGASLAFAAPVDQLFTATEVNEWAWLASLAEIPKSNREASSDFLPFSPREKVPEGRMREVRPTDSEPAEGAKKLPFGAETVDFIRQLRNQSTDPERLLWSFLRDRRVLGQKFRRQFAIDPYVLDFYCHDLKLAIELDGGQHNDEQHIAQDRQRDDFLRERGIHTLRYWNHDIMQRLEDVLADVWENVQLRMASIENFRDTSAALPSSALRAPSPGGRREADAPSAAGGGFDPGGRREADAPSAAGGGFDPEGRREADALLPFSLREKVARQRRMREGTDDLPDRGGEARQPSPLPHAPGHPAAWDEDSALQTLHAHARAERNPRLAELVASAQTHRLTVLIDDDELSIGSGAGSQRWPVASLPSAIDWNALHDIPVALVTGSNGKTTCVRLLAAIVRAQRLRTAYSCTDGLFIDDVALDAGDYSGPAGARALLRHADAEAAILETARGGILRRGIAPQRVRTAIVTNISDDHFGEYGVHTLDDLAAVKLTVARVVDADGMLVLNADDAVLARHAASVVRPFGWFALDDAHPMLVAHRAQGGATCGVHAGRLILTSHGTPHDLGVVADMPLTFGARATYNIANIAAAALAATALDIAPATIADVLTRFGATHADNPGRLQRWSLGKTNVLLDYAHNPEGLRALLDVAAGARADGRLVLVLGQAGNRGDAEIRELAAVAAGFRPDRIVLKDIAGMLRGRAPGEVPAILRDELVRNGVADEAIEECLDEAGAARAAIAWARAGDIVVLPIHSAHARAEIVTLLDGLALG